MAPGGPRFACALRGWRNPQPIAISLRPDDIAALRESVRRDLAALIPRCEALERSLPDRLRHHRAYAASKVPQDFDLDVSYDFVPGGSAIAAMPQPVPRIHHAAVPAADVSLAESLRRTGSILTVGVVADPDLRTLLVKRGAGLVTPGDGAPTMTPSGRRRPGAGSFSAWMAEHDENERAAVGTFVLGRTAGRADVDLLRHRIHGHQHVMVEAGSAAFAWLLAYWDGRVARHGDVFAFFEPGSLFREPSTQARLSTEADWPRISVVTVSYNQCEYLEQCLTSVLDQNYPNLEYIVIDGGSTDGSVDILRRYERHFTHLVIEPDEGQGDALNKGFQRAAGEILTWVNSDDMLSPLSLKRAALAFAESGGDLVAGTCSRVAGANAGLLYRYFSALPTEQRVPFDLSGPLDWCNAWEKGDYFFQPEVFFTRSIWQRAGGYIKPHLYWAMDWDLWLRCALAGATVIRIPDVLAASREHAAQKTTSNMMYLWQITTILREYDELLARLERETVMA